MLSTATRPEQSAALVTAPSSKLALQTTDLTRVYRVGRNTITALDGVDLSIGRGEFVAIMGPSGCGKSTLLNLLGGLDRPTRGSVQLASHDLSELGDEAMAGLRRSTLGFIFQRHDLFPFLTARENVEFPMMLGGANPADRRQRSDALLARVGLADRADYLPDELSGGQQQRVGIARALINNPTVLLADEPTGNLDSVTAGEVLDVMADLVRQAGLTLVMVTHSAEDAARADRIVRLRDGRIIDNGGSNNGS